MVQSFSVFAAETETSASPLTSSCASCTEQLSAAIDPLPAHLSMSTARAHSSSTACSRVIAPAA